MYEYGVSFKYVRYLQDYGSFHFCYRCVTLFLPMTKSLGGGGTSIFSSEQYSRKLTKLIGILISEAEEEEGVLNTVYVEIFAVH